MRFYISIIYVFLTSTIVVSQEEPSKFLYEKTEKELIRNRLRENRVRNITTWTHAVKNGKIIEPGLKTIVREFDSTGRVNLFLSFHYDSILRRIEYTYDKSGNLFTSSEYGPKDNLIENTAFYYDNAGRLVSGISLDANHEKKSYFRLIREDSIHQVKFIQYNPYNQPQYIVYYLFPAILDSVDYIFATQQDAYGNLTSFVEKKHNSLGKILEQKIFNPDKSLKYTFFYQYTQQGFVSKISKQLPDGATEWTEEYLYGIGGICTSIQHFNAGNELKWITRFECEYYPK